MAKKKKVVKRQYRELNITPKRAAEMLKRSEALNIPQRPCSKAWVEKYARMMRMGDWECNGVTIKLSARGAVVDGQHRLAAVVLANVPIRMAVAQNVAISALIFHYPTFGLPAREIGLAMLTLATLLTLWSGYVYFAQYFGGLHGDTPSPGSGT